uniref:ST3 beta-galactoside alpha-2,3-sialyltransferase 4 n=1 Tax=Pelusios castaneus TaxID=367368 RepID=A0A8C8SQ16_9SAUR
MLQGEPANSLCGLDWQLSILRQLPSWYQSTEGVVKLSLCWIEFQVFSALHLHGIVLGRPIGMLDKPCGPFSPLSSLRCRRCVVVGNSNSMRGRGFGAIIDSHNIIIRLNNAPVKEHKEDVGEKTSIRLFFPESALPNPLDNNDNETLMVLIPFKSLDFTWVKEVLLKTRNKTTEGFWRQPPTEWKGNASHLRILHPYVTYEATYKLLQLEKLDGKYSTTGIIALNLALHICQEVNVIGFGYPDRTDNSTPVHYYGTEHLSKVRRQAHGGVLGHTGGRPWGTWRWLLGGVFWGP